MMTAATMIAIEMITLGSRNWLLDSKNAIKSAATATPITSEPITSRIVVRKEPIARLLFDLKTVGWGWAKRKQCADSVGGGPRVF
jgi:hypothetical protein